MPHRTTAFLWRAFLAAALVCAVGLLPWLTRTDPALTVLKARSAERDPDPEVLAAVRTHRESRTGSIELVGHAAHRATATPAEAPVIARRRARC